MAYWSIIGTAKSGTPKNFGITLDTVAETWTVGGPAAARLFKSKSGKFDFHVLPTIGTTLVNAGGKIVARLDGLTATSAIGATGSGHQEETAEFFDWKLDSK